MKRVFSLILIASLLLSLFSLLSCETDKLTTDSPQESTSAPTTTATPQEDNDPIGETVKLMTFNLRYDTTSHPCMSTEVRGAHMMEIIQKYMPDSVGFNEATNDWMNYLRSSMKEYNYESVGVGRDSGTTGSTLTGVKNEHTPVFYRADKFDLVDSGNFWLSVTPDMPVTVSWNSARKRICTYAILRNKVSGETYAHFSTHLDHVSVEAQYNGVMVIESHIREIVQKYGDIGIVLSGDFNATRFDESDPTYIPTTYNTVTSFMDDSRDLADKRLVDGSSWSGYQNPVDWENGHTSNNDKPAVDTSKSPIDFIFLKKNCYQVSLYTIVDDVFTFEYDNKTWTNHPISDHYGVYCEASLIQRSVSLDTDDKKLIDIPAAVAPVETVPKQLSDILVDSKGFTATSSLPVKAASPIQNLFKNDSSVASVTVAGRTHGFWEITISFNELTLINGISFTTGEGEKIVPQISRIYSSEDGINWKQIGSALYDVSHSTTYLITPEEVVSAISVKLLFSDAVTNSELSNVSVYGTVKSTGKIASNRITPISGPKSGEKEGYEKLFDNNTSTKFYIRLYNNDSVPQTPDPVDPIIFSTDSPTTIVSYSLTNANDTNKFPGRLPRQWSLYGSVSGDDGSYEIIDRVVNPEITTENYATSTFTVDTPKSYQFYKLVFDVIGTTGNVQFSEITFFEE